MIVGNVPDMAMKTIELIEDFYENTMGMPTHICQYDVVKIVHGLKKLLRS